VSIRDGRPGDNTAELVLSDGDWRDGACFESKNVFLFTGIEGNLDEPKGINSSPGSEKVFRVSLFVPSGNSWTGTVAINADQLRVSKGKAKISGPLTIGDNEPVTITAAIRDK
jgi:hypothetical protein